MRFNRCCGEKAALTDRKRDECLVTNPSSGFCLLSMRWRQPEQWREHTERRRGGGKKKGFLAGTQDIYCITAVFNKRHSSIDLNGGNFSKHPAELKDRWNPRAGLIEGFLFKALNEDLGEKEFNFQVSQFGRSPENKKEANFFLLPSSSPCVISQQSPAAFVQVC